MRKTLIITGGSINIEFALSYLKNNTFDYVIAVDGGLEKASLMPVTINCVLGDFDTISEEVLRKYEKASEGEIERYIPEKDFTDTEAAIKKAIAVESSEVHILGGIGSRLDHTFANIMLLQYGTKENVDIIIVNENNRVRLIGESRKSICIKDSEYKYLSLLPLTDTVTNVTTVGLKYNIENYTFNKNENISLGVSNEINSVNASISIETGKLLVIESRD